MIRNIILIILILAGIATIVLLDVPGVQVVLQTRKSIEDQKKVLSDKRDFLARMEELSMAYEENKENIEKIEFILPSKEEIPNLIVQLESLVKEQGLLLDKLEVSVPTEELRGMINPEDAVARKETTAVEYKTLIINLGFTGDYSALKNFLKATEENMRLIDIDSVSISPESEVPGIFSFDLSLKTYYQK